MRRWPLTLVFLLAPAACRGSVAVPSPGPASDAALDPPPAEAVASATPSTRARVETDWCVAGLEPLDEQSCFFLPPSPMVAPRRLLVYLHGIVPPTPTSEPKENVMRLVRSAAARAGAAALVPRGIRGVGPGAAKDWWAWPTSPGKLGELAPALATRLLAEKRALEALAGTPFDRTYLAGSSNGAYFAVTLALSGAIDVDALGAMSGGAPAKVAPKRPIAVYVGYGAHDARTRSGAVALARSSRAAGLPTKLAEHPFGHGAREVYLDEAFAFWDAAVGP